MRISDVITTDSQKRNKTSNKTIVSLGLLISGVLLAVIVLVTFYGQFTGTYFIQVKGDADQKGIVLSTSKDFKNPSTKLEINPVMEVDDLLEEHALLNKEKVFETNGQYFDKEIKNYIGYTFYIKNTSSEIIDLNYFIRISHAINGLDKAVKVKLFEWDLNTGVEIERPSSLKSENSNDVLTAKIQNILANGIRKISMFVWIDGEHTDDTMLNGRVRLSFVISIANAEENISEA